MRGQQCFIESVYLIYLCIEKKIEDIEAYIIRLYVWFCKNYRTVIKSNEMGK